MPAAGYFVAVLRLFSNIRNVRRVMGQIVIVEEDAVVLQQLKQCLEAKGHLVWHFTNTAEALVFLNQYEPGLIICSVCVTNTDSIDFLRTLKNSPFSQKVPFVFYCAQPEQQHQYITDARMKSAKILGAKKYIINSDFNANAVWEQLQDCLAETSLKRDTLGSQVRTYSLSDLS